MLDLFTSMSGAAAQERKLDIISNNLANISTAGFRKEDITINAAAPQFRFANMWDEQLEHVQDLGKPVPPVYMRLAEIGQQRLNLTAGALFKTDNPYDVALNETKPELKGRAFFVTESPAGETLYIRDGQFAVQEQNGSSRLVHQGSGLPVMGAGNSPIDLPAGEVKILADGRVKVGDQEVAKLHVVAVESADALQRRGSGLYAVKTEAAPPQDLTEGDYHVQQGFIEQSNVNTVDELVRMIHVQRSYEAMMKSIQAADDSYGRLIGIAL